MRMATSGSKNGSVSDPNIVPLIDVLLVLIIIFMVIYAEGAHWITYRGPAASATKTRTARAPYHRGAGDARREAHD